MSVTQMKPSKSSQKDSDDDEVDDGFDFDDDIIAMLTKKQPKGTPLDSLARKKPSLFDEDKLTGVKKVKHATPTIAPSFFNKSSAAILKKSNELVALKEKDDAEAVKLLKEDNEIREKIHSSLSEDAAKDTSYVRYLTANYDSLNLYDFHFIEKPDYVKASEGTAVEMTMIRDTERPIHGDVFNSLDYDYVNSLSYTPPKPRSERRDRKSNRSTNTKDINTLDEIETFMKNIGVSNENLKLRSIEDHNLKIDPKYNLQSIPLLILKLSKFIEYLVTKKFTETEFSKIVCYLGLIIIDIKVFNHGQSRLFSQMINSLVKWQFEATSELKLDKIIRTWNSLTSRNIFLIRIVETLDASYSPVVSQLKLQFAVSILNVEPFEFRYFEKSQDLRELINDVMIKELKQLRCIDFSDSAVCDYIQIRFKFQVMVYLLDRQNDSQEFINEFKDLIKDINRKTPRSLSDTELSLLKSVISMISNLI